MRGLGFVFALLLILMIGALGTARADVLPSVLVRPVFARILLETDEGLEIFRIVLGSRPSESDLSRLLRTLAHPENRALALDLGARASEVEAAVDGVPARDQVGMLRKMARRELRLAVSSEGTVHFSGGETHLVQTTANLEFIGWKVTPTIEERFVAGDSRTRDQALSLAWKAAQRPGLKTATVRARAIQVMEYACESVASAELELRGLNARLGWPRNPTDVIASLRLVDQSSVQSRLAHVFAPADWNRHERLVTQYQAALKRLPDLVAALENLR
jgi:hypothetical protein